MIYHRMSVKRKKTGEGALVKRRQLARPAFGVLQTLGASRVPGPLPIAEVPRCLQAQGTVVDAVTHDALEGDGAAAGGHGGGDEGGLRQVSEGDGGPGRGSPQTDGSGSQVRRYFLTE